MYLNLSLNTKLKSKSMGADYFIIKQLRIEHSQGTSTIELERETVVIFQITHLMK